MENTSSRGRPSPKQTAKETAEQKAKREAIATYLRMWRQGLLLGILIAIAASFSTSQAQATTIPCADQEAECRHSGDFSAVSVANPNANGAGITSPRTPAFGAMIYSDFVQVEARAHAFLARAVGVRQSISPYQKRIGFDLFLDRLDTEAGLTKVYTPTTPYGTGLTRVQLVNAVESDLTEARNLYAFLAVYAPENRFRHDPTYIANNGKLSFCGATNKENPDPIDTAFEGQVKPPVVDWCDFKARLRQSVREAANIRMMVGQQFMVEALGDNFSANIIGGDAYVRQEVAKLRAAQNQFKLADQYLASSLTKVAGDGCLVSDFYTEGEWSLLSRSVDSQATVQFLIGTRLSYLNGSTTQSVKLAKDQALVTFRQGVSDTYVKMVGLAALGRTNQGSCAHGEHPDDNAIADMALNMLDAQKQAHDISSGRNIFGFDVTFTPNRPYKSSGTRNCQSNATGNRGLWDEAYCDAEAAAKLQIRAENTDRLFDDSQTALRASAEALITGIDQHIDDVVSCTRKDIGNDNDFFACAEKQIALYTVCLGLIEEATFDGCMAQKILNKGNDAATAMFDLRSAYLDFRSVQKSMDNINQRVKISHDTSEQIEFWMGFAGAAETAARVSQVFMDAADCEDFDNVESAIASAAACGPAAMANTAVQLFAGGLSTTADVKTVDLEGREAIQNMLLDQSELYISTQSSYQAYLSKLSDTTGILTALTRDVAEDKAQHAYFDSSPANDPAFRIVRDSARLELADALEIAAKIAYLAARRAEYEYAARLPASQFRISDIYRARSAQDIMKFLDTLQGVTDNIPGSTSQEIQPIDITISVAFDLVPENDDASLIRAGFTTPQQMKDERLKRFRRWVADNTIADPDDGKPTLKFQMTTSLLKGGIFDDLISKSDTRWRLILGGIGSPDDSNTGMGVNIVTNQPNLSFRTVQITQGGLLHLRAQSGCVFDYHLMAPAFLLGYEWSKTQQPDEVDTIFNANVNNSHPATEPGFRTRAFEGRAASATDWEIEISGGTKEHGLATMDLQQMTDIELHMSAVYTTRKAGEAKSGECSRLDF